MANSIRHKGVAVLLAVCLMPFAGASPAFAEPGEPLDGQALSSAEIEPISLDIPEVERPFDARTVYGADEPVAAAEPAIEALSADEGGISLLSAPTTFAELQSAIASAPDNGTVEVGSDIEIESALLLPANRTITLTSEAGTTRTLRRSATTSYVGNLFEIGNGSKLVLTDIVIDGGGTSVTGVTGSLIKLGADGHLEVNDGAVLQNNILDMTGSSGYNLRYNGAAINATGEGATMVFNDGCLIDGNSAPVQEGDSGHGGAVSAAHHFEGAATVTITVNGGTFSNNSAGSGGAFCVGRNTTLTVHDGDFLNNTDLNYFGGAIMALGGLNVYGGTFDGNVGSRGGGAICYMGSEEYGNSFTMTGGTFTNNVGQGLGLGGAIACWGTGLISITGGTIGSLDPADGNEAVAGGGICIVSEKGSKPITIGGTTKIIGNSVSGEGGAIAYTTNDNGQDCGSLTLSGDLEVANNSANEVGGVYISNGDDYGAAIVSIGIVDNVSIHDNAAVGACGGLYIAGFTGAITGNVSIADNTSGGIGGGVIATQIAGATEGNFTFSDNVEISGNSANVAGGMILSGGCTATLEDDASVTGNSVAGIVGGVYIAENATLNVTDRAIISGNSAGALVDGVVVIQPSTLNVWGTPQIGTSDTDNGVYLDSNMYATVPAGEDLLAGSRVNFEGIEDGAATGSLVAKRADGSAAAADESAFMAYTPGGFDVIRNAAEASEYVLDETTPPVPVKSLAIARLYGADRFETGSQVATYERDIAQAQALIVASGSDRNFPDALSASSLSGANGNAPIVLTDPTALPGTTREVLAAASSASKVYIIGDQYAVSNAVEAEIASLLPGAQVVRIGGEGRQQTAELVFAELGASASKTAILARSMNFPDSLAISSWAAHTTSPIFLTGFDERSLTQGTLDALAAGGFDRLIVLGDEYSVPPSVANEARAAAGVSLSNTIRLAGDERVATSLAIAEWTTDPARGAEALSYDNLVVARANNHADALSGGALQGMHGSVILLTWPGEVHPGVVSAITGASDGISEIRFLGDEYSVSVPLMQAYVKAIQFDQHTWKPDDSIAFDLG